MANPKVCDSGSTLFTIPCPPYNSPTLAYQCMDYDTVNNYCVSYAWLELSPSVDITPEQSGHLVEATAFLFALAFVFNFLFKFMLNK